MGFWILDFWILDLRFLDFGMLDFGIWGFCDFGMLDFGIWDFGSQHKNGVTWQRSTMVPGPKVYNGRCTISDLLPGTPRGLSLQTLST